MTDEERDIAEGIPARAYGTGPYGAELETAGKGGARRSARGPSACAGSPDDSWAATDRSPDRV